MARRIFINDGEVAQVMEISQSTLSRIMHGLVRGGIKRKTASAKFVDINKAEPISIGGFRRWNAAKLANVLGISEEELWRRIS